MQANAKDIRFSFGQVKHWIVALAIAGALAIGAVSVGTFAHDGTSARPSAATRYDGGHEASFEKALQPGPATVGQGHEASFEVEDAISPALDQLLYEYELYNPHADGALSPAMEQLLLEYETYNPVVE